MLSKALPLACLIYLVIACSSSKKSTNSVTAADISVSDSIAGLEFVAKNDCYTCHGLKEKIVAPPFASIANKYDKTNESIERLSAKIKKGGNGSWGKVPMIPHQDLAPNESELIVKYILSLKNK
jgi:cytochrome c